MTFTEHWESEFQLAIARPHPNVVEYAELAVNALIQDEPDAHEKIQTLARDRMRAGQNRRFERLCGLTIKRFVERGEC
jgi:hypothetical protein